MTAYGRKRTQFNMNIKFKRVYEDAQKNDGSRILVDRLWPRGIKKEKAKINFWAKDVAPSNDLRKWYNHVPSKWEEFKTRYFKELDHNEKALTELLKNCDTEIVTFVFSSKEMQLNNATALKEYLENSRNI